MIKRALSPIAIAAVAVALAGCVSLFPKAKPAQMYRFGVLGGAAAVSTTNASVARAPTAFNRAAAGDRLLTVNGQEIAYLAEARWATPAAVMFDDAVERTFDHRASGPRLITRGDLTSAPISLRLDVDTFEARYLDGAKAAPTVVVSMRATIVRNKDRTILGEQIFTASKRAGDNRIAPIVDAYDGAVKESLAAMADWAAATVPAGA